MTRTWFTADTHFGHSNIIGHCARPFATVAEMDAELVARWNSVVQPDDNVWVIGDFAFRGTKGPGEYLLRLKGQKHLVIGNHDSAATCAAPGWASVQQMAEITVEHQRLILCHYSMRVWPRSHHGALMLYGHSHGQLPGDRQSLDVGVDCWGYRPVSLTEIRQRLATLPERAS